MLRGCKATLLGACFTLTVPSAIASPWDRVRDGGTGMSVEVLTVATERNREPREDRNFRPEDYELLNRRAAVMLQIAHAERHDHETLAYLFADTLFEAGDGFHEAAWEALSRALERFPDSPHAAAAWANLGTMANEIGEARVAGDAFTRALDRTWHEEIRAQLFLLRAEAAMSLGDTAAALADYRTVAESGALSEYVVRAEWGAAVALERSHDLPQGLELVRRASAVRFRSGGALVGVLDLAGTRFQPAYDEHYYRALAIMADALAVPNRARAAEMFQTAAFLWSLYLTDARRDAPPSGEPPWIANAERHRARCAERAEALGKGPAPLLP